MLVIIVIFIHILQGVVAWSWRWTLNIYSDNGILASDH